MPVTEFKAKCLRLLDDVEKNSDGSLLRSAGGRSHRLALRLRQCPHCAGFGRTQSKFFATLCILTMIRGRPSWSDVLTEQRDKTSRLVWAPFSLRELAMMAHRRRISVDLPLDGWLESIESHPLITILPLTSTIAAESVRLGEDFPRDPADQIIVATARCHGLTLITADERIRKWGKVIWYSKKVLPILKAGDKPCIR